MLEIVHPAGKEQIENVSKGSSQQETGTTKWLPVGGRGNVFNHKFFPKSFGSKSKTVLSTGDGKSIFYIFVPF